MHKLIIALIISFAATSCHHTQKKKEESYFPVLSFLKSQVAHMDTSIYPIRKILITDSLHSDTLDIKREEFHELAKDFLDIPDLASKQYRSRFKEEKIYDAMLDRAILTYQPINPDKEELQRQEVLIIPNPPNDKVNTIIIEKTIENKDGFVQKKMLWKVDESFQVTTITQKPGGPETSSTLKVTWNQ